MNPKTKSIFITGDIANDYFLIRGKRFYSDDEYKNHYRAYCAYHKVEARLYF